MAKKRKAASRVAPEQSGPAMDIGHSRKRIRTYEDVADSDDDFHINRDKVLLDEEPDTKRRRKWQEEEEFLQPSDEEVLDYSEAEEDEASELDETTKPRVQQGESSASEHSESGDEDDDLAWGTSKADLYGADAIETEEQALEEEAEALRLQRKQLQSMNAADYGFDEDEWQDSNKVGGQAEDARDNAVVTEVLPQLQIPEDATPAERLKLLKLRYPEFEPLTKELLDIQEVLQTLTKDADPSNPNAVTKFRAASAYAGVLTMYFALLTSTANRSESPSTAMSANQLRDHPIMESLIKCRALWLEAKKLPADANSAALPEQRNEGTNATHFANGDSKAREPLKQDRKPKKSRAQRHAEATQAAAEARKAERMERTEADLADLDTLINSSAATKTTKRKRIASATVNGDDSDVGEETPLTAQEAAEKAQRKKSLRFYTSQIAQNANKRGAAGRNAGGDEDIPHRERLRDRQARLNAEAEKRGRKQADVGDDLGGASDDEDHNQAQQIRDGADDDDYYDMIAARTSKKKSDKAALAEVQRQAALQGGQVVQQETIGADGKRKISYLIEKNKGLTPHRKKDVRNPRVKKRKKYDEKKKKLASMKPVYKGGEGRGGYGGELTGIKKGLVKSTKL